MTSLAAILLDGAPATATPGESRFVRKPAWRIRPQIMGGYPFAFFDRINLSIAKASPEADLSLRDAAWSFGAGFVRGRSCAVRSREPLIHPLGQPGGIVSRVVVGGIRGLTGGTTPAPYVIGCPGPVCAAILMDGIPATLRSDATAARRRHVTEL